MAKRGTIDENIVRIRDTRLTLVDEKKNLVAIASFDLRCHVARRAALKKSFSNGFYSPNI